MIAIVIGTDVENCDQVGVFQIQTLRNTAQFNFQVLLQQFECNLFTGIAEGIIHFTKPTAMDGSLNCKAFERR